ncbi:MAG: cytidylyltransferase domain-containing protein [Gemmatimonadota bacterium]
MARRAPPLEAIWSSRQRAAGALPEGRHQVPQRGAWATRTRFDERLGRTRAIAGLLRPSHQNAIAIIPARGGSKRIRQKNLVCVAGVPLVAHTIRQALSASLVREVWVSTDHPEIVSVAKRHGAIVVERPPHLSTDGAASESALLHALDERNQQGLPDPELVVFLQTTSPIRRPKDIDGAIGTLVRFGYDSVFSACKDTRLIWRSDADGPRPVNYDFRRRQREQEMPRQLAENGSIYVVRAELLRRTSNRLGGRIGVYEMDYWSSFQIDEPQHLELCEWILRRPEYQPPIPWPRRIELVVFDFDGVMTDNTVTLDSDGKERVVCHRGDGWGIARLRERRARVLVLSTEANPVVSVRCRKLGVECHQEIANKGEHLRQHLRRLGIPAEHVVYVGNDVNDLGCLQMVGLPVAVADAHPEVLRAANWVLTQPGGRGAVREVCDRVGERLDSGA